MSKSVTDSKPKRAAVRASQGTSAAKTARHVDPALRRAVQIHGFADPLTVMVKLDTKHSAFGQHPVSNRPGSAREIAFSQEVHAMVRDAGALAITDYRIVSAAANLGVATVQAPAGVVKGLLGSTKIAGMKLKTE